MKIFIWLGFLLLSNNIWAEHLDLDQLLRAVKQTQGVEGKINRQREQQFVAEKNKQQQRLATTQTKLNQQRALSQQLKLQMEINEKELTELEIALKERSGVLGELFGVARQAAGDLKAGLEQSLISAQMPERTQKLDELATNKALPTIEQLENLWFTLQQEMTESGKVVYYEDEILSASGEPRQAKVIRIGSFSALADGNYLRYLSETTKLAEFARQPEQKYLDLNNDFSNSQDEFASMGIDPTGGVILSMLVKAPNGTERIQQGGVIGYIILVMGGLGMLYAILRLVQLSLTAVKIHKQVETKTADTSNPLGRIILATEQANIDDIQTLELVLDEAITRELPVLEKGLSMIKLLAAVAPLLGLLGTVTGMIATFQAISLFGTGDPKLMANGISQALVTTMLGLIVAIPLLFMHSLVASRSRSLIQILDEQSAGLISRRLGK